MATPTNVFYLIDDTSNTSGSTVLGSSSGMPVSPEFTIPTGSGTTSAQWIAQQFATMFQRTVRLVQKYGAQPPWTPAYLPNTTSLALSNSPSGISY